MKKKSLTALLLSVAVTSALFTGCAGNESSTTTSGSNTGSASASSGAAASSDDGKTSKISGELEVAVFSNGELMDKFWNTVVEEFNSLYPDCKVTLNASPKIEDTVRPRFVSNTPPDIYYMGGTANADETALTQDGQFMDLSEFYNTAEAIGYDGLLKDNMAVELFNRSGDSIYGMGFGYSVWGYYYNKTMAEEYGWEPPTNWEEFCELAPKIKEKGIYPIIHQGKYPDYMGYGLIHPGIATDAGQDLLLQMGNLDTSAYDSKEVISAYDKLEQLVKNDWTPANALSLTHTEAQMEWLLGKAFIIPCGNWLEGEMAEDIPEGFEMAFMPSFWHDSTNTSTYVGSSPRISIAANTKNPEAAKAFLQVLFSKNVTQAVAECQMGIPCMRDDLEGVELTASNQDILKQVSEGSVQIINEVGGSGNFEPYAELRTATTNAISSILGGQKTSEEALEGIKQEADRIAADDGIAKITIS